MKILQVNKFNYLRGGAEKYFIEISKKLEEKGHQVAVFSMHHPKNIASVWSSYFVSRISFNEGGWRNFLLSPMRILYSLEAKRKFERIIKDFEPDIIHIHNIYHQLSPSILSVAKKYAIPVVMHLHDYKLICPNYQLFVKDNICFRCKKTKYYNCLKYRCFKGSFWKSFLITIEMYFHHKILKIYRKNIDFFIAPSAFMKKTVASFSWPEEKIKLIYNFFDKIFKETDSDISDYGLYFGRLSREKGIHILLQALSMSSSKMKLNIVGSGPEENNLKNITRELGLSDRVSFLGPKYGDDLQKIVSRAKMVFLPSIWCENMPLVLLESLSLAKVVIASKTGGLPELIEDKKSGFLFENANPSSLAKIIDDIDNYDLNKIGEEARKKVEGLNIDNHLKKLLLLYEEAIKVSSP
jgi:glycosyltransferase involved in cell wall biosynthesis